MEQSRSFSKTKVGEHPIEQIHLMITEVKTKHFDNPKETFKPVDFFDDMHDLQSFIFDASLNISLDTYQITKINFRLELLGRLASNLQCKDLHLRINENREEKNPQHS